MDVFLSEEAQVGPGPVDSLKQLQNIRIKLDRVASRISYSAPADVHDLNSAHEQNSPTKRKRRDSGLRILSRNDTFWDEVRDTGRRFNEERNVSIQDHHRRLRRSAKRNEELGQAIEKYGLIVNSNPKKHVLLLQYPDRLGFEMYCTASGQKPLELRIKPKCGLVEVDIPISMDKHYNRSKGRKFGGAIHHHKTQQDNATRQSTLPKRKSYGPASAHVGPDVVMADIPSEGDEGSEMDAMAPTDDASDDEEPLGARSRRRRDRAPRESERQDELLPTEDHFGGEMINGDDFGGNHFMDKFTLGGRIVPFEAGNPIYMIATFQAGRFRNILRTLHEMLMSEQKPAHGPKLMRLFLFDRNSRISMHCAPSAKLQASRNQARKTNK